MKKSGSAVFLMELILVILFFSLSAVVTLRLFAVSHQQERQSAQISDAMELAANTAERFRAQGAALFRPDAGWSAAGQDGGATLYTCTREGLRIEVLLKEKQTGAGTLETGEVRVKSGEQSEALCCLALGRYSPKEEAP